MTSEKLERSATWRQMGDDIARDFQAGIPFPQIHMMNIAIKQHTLAPYERHRQRVGLFLWTDDPAPKTIIELGAGYGAMANFWPAAARVYNVDLPEMLEVQRHYLVNELHAQPLGDHTYQLPAGPVIELVPFTEADRLPFDGAYLFSTWALTETTYETWEYYIDKAPRLAGCYLVGWRGWIDIPHQLWPWPTMRNAFKTVRADLLPYTDYDGAATDSLELAAVNR